MRVIIETPVAAHRRDEELGVTHRLLITDAHGPVLEVTVLDARTVQIDVLRLHDVPRQDGSTRTLTVGAAAKL
jgi:hypothetical protein